MCTSKTLYLGELQRCIDEVTGGESGAILHDEKLHHDYDSDMLELVWHAVGEGNDDVRAELIMLLADLNEDSVYNDIEALADGSSPTVGAACRAYTLKIGESRRKADCLMDVMETAEGPEFREAVRDLMPLVREDDVPRLCGIRDGAQESDARDIGVLLRMLMVRNPHLSIDDGL